MTPEQYSYANKTNGSLKLQYTSQHRYQLIGATHKISQLKTSALEP